MIETLSVSNFKSWANLQNMRFGKITALFGANSSGKTSLIQFLLALKQTAASRDRRILNFGGDEQFDFVDLGSYEDVVYAHDLTRNIGFSLQWDPAQSFSEYDQTVTLFDASIDVTYSYALGQVVVKERTYNSYIKGLELVGFSEEQDIQEYEEYQGKYQDEIHQLDDGLYLRRITWPPDNKVNEYSQVQFKSFYKSYLRKIEPGAGEWSESGWLEAGPSAVLDNSFERLLESIYYLGPLRDYPHRTYRWTGERPRSVGTRGEYAIQAALANLVARDANGSSEAQQQELVANANAWLQRLGLVDQIELRPIGAKSRLYELVVKSRGYNHEANVMDVGFGVSQILPVIILAYFVPPNSTIILEQPEIHLHPKVQAELADFFLEIALERNVQFLIESHSEHLLNRLQYRTTERSGKFATLQDGDVRLYFCRREPETSVLEPVQIGEAGNIANVPTDFYDPISDFIGTLQVNADGQPSDLSERHDEYIAQNLTRRLRDKDDQSE